MLETAHRYSERAPVVPRRFSFTGAVGWFGGAGSGYRAGSAKVRGEKAEGPFPVPRMDGIVLSSASRTSLR